MIDTYIKGKNILIMVWGAIWVSERLDIYIINRDLESKKEGYSHKSYIDVLNDQLPIIWSPGIIFMQDNAPIHIANAIRQWFENHVIPVLEWLPYSPDLNPIEIVWAWLKEWITIKGSELSELGKSEKAYQRLYRAIREA